MTVLFLSLFLSFSSPTLAGTNPQGGDNTALIDAVVLSLA